MTRNSTRLKAAYIGLAALDTVLSGSTSPWAHRARYATKPLLMPVLAASLATAPGAAPLRTPVLAAQAAGWVGDVALLSEQKKPLLTGMSAFATGHAAYISGFAKLRDRRTKLFDGKPARALAGVWAINSPVVAFNASRKDLALPVVAYSASLTSMAISATRLDESVSPAARRYAAAGALSFLLSDSLLGLRKFVLDEPPPVLEAAVMATYTTAQFLLSEAAQA